jgi:peptidylprolyl isomerase
MGADGLAGSRPGQQPLTLNEVNRSNLLLGMVSKQSLLQPEGSGKDSKAPRKESIKMVKAKYGDKVQVHFTGRLDDGTVFATTGGSGRVIFRPVELVLGQEDDLLPKFHEAIVGLEAGTTVTARIAYEDAYGPHSDELVHEVPRSDIQEKEDRAVNMWIYPNGKTLPFFKPKVGEQVTFCLPDGDTIPAIVSHATETTYTFDTNHPLAGQDLTFDITLVNIL